MKLELTELQNRMKTYAKDNYLFIYSVMKGANLANAALTLAILVAGGAKPLLPRLAFWVVSFAAMVLTYNTTFRGIITTGFRLNWLDSLLPFTLAIIEFLLFSVLLPPGSFYLPSDAPDTFWNHWYLIFALHGINASILVWNRARLLKYEDFDTELHELVGKFEGWLERDIKGAAINGTVWTIVWAVMVFYVLPLFPSLQMWQWLLAIPALATMIFVIYTAEKDREVITEFLTQETQPQSQDDVPLIAPSNQSMDVRAKQRPSSKVAR